jgi:hypothetical protein
VEEVLLPVLSYAEALVVVVFVEEVSVLELSVLEELVDEELDDEDFLSSLTYDFISFL